MLERKIFYPKIVFLLTIFDVFGASVLLPLVGLVPRYEIIKSQRK